MALLRVEKDGDMAFVGKADGRALVERSACLDDSFGSVRIYVVVDINQQQFEISCFV